MAQDLVGALVWRLVHKPAATLEIFRLCPEAGNANRLKWQERVCKSCIRLDLDIAGKVVFGKLTYMVRLLRI